MKVETSVEVWAVLFLQIGHQLTQRLFLFGHDVGQQQRVEDAVALWQVSGVTDAA